MRKIAWNALRLCTSSYFNLVFSRETVRGNHLNSKHDDSEFTRLNIVWVGNISDGIFWIGIMWVGIFWMEIFEVGVVLVRVILGGNFPSLGFSGWELSGGNHPGGSFPSTFKLTYITIFFNITNFTIRRIIIFYVYFKIVKQTKFKTINES